MNTQTTNTDQRSTRLWRLLLGIFAVSGFAGLIYEAIWGRYLKLFLGHSAYAQTFVVAIFMGGMALGAWWVAQRSAQWTSLLRGYAWVEIAIGLYAFAFQFIFESALDWAYDTVMPALGVPAAVQVFKHGLATALILPPSIALGMTFPLMSGGLIRRLPHASGTSLAMLYFTNSLGAALGVFCTGFVLVPILGLPGSILLAGVLNLGVGLVVFWAVASEETPPSPIHPQQTPSSRESPISRRLVAVAALTGFASFLYEIGWIRMLSIVLGSSSHAFEIMLGTFILGLALGGLWVKGRIDKIENPVSFLGWVQWVMGLTALATVFVYHSAFDVMAALMTDIERTEQGYTFFNLASHAICICIMLPAAFCAGTTLPLMTNALLKRNEGERSIGRIYAVNTIGAIAGVLVATHLAMPYLGLKGLIVLGASIDIAIGLWLLRGAKPARLKVNVAIGASMVLAVISIVGVQFDPLRMASGVYRSARIMSDDEYTSRFHKDGKTASIDVLEHRSGQLILATNGKVDAGFNPRDSRPSADEVTQSILAIMPVAAYPAARTMAIIGMGSGMTSSVALLNPGLERVDTIEIESAVIEAAQLFRPMNERVFTDPRSRLIIDDARSVFATHQSTYDIIISEPSNPWVSGVASLFSKEFYRRIAEHLSPTGILAQWIQLYELEPRLVATILKALQDTFPEAAVFATNNNNLLIMARRAGPIGQLSQVPLETPSIRAELARHGIGSMADLRLHRIADLSMLKPLLSTYAVPANSDYFPFLDNHAVKARFLKKSAKNFVRLPLGSVPMLALLDSKATDPVSQADVRAARQDLPNHPPLLRQANTAQAWKLLDALNRDIPLDGSVNDVAKAVVGHIARHQAQCTNSPALNARQQIVMSDALHTLGKMINVYIPAPVAASLWTSLTNRLCPDRLGELPRLWLTLMKQMSARNLVEMNRSAAQLLQHPAPLTQAQRTTLVMCRLVALTDQKKPGAAIELWREHAEHLPTDTTHGLRFRLLLAHATRSEP